MKKNLYILLLFAILVTPALLQAAQPVWGWKANSGKTTLAAHDDSQDNDKPGRFFRARNGDRPKLGQLIQNGIEKVIDAANERNDNVND